MPQKYTSEQFWKLYEKLPQDLKDALFAEETGNNIYEICKRNEIEENLEAIVDCVGQVLVGVLLPADFQETIEKELKLEKEVAKKVAHEINRFIFYPVKPALEQLYKIEITPLAKSSAEPSETAPSEIAPSETIPSEVAPSEEKLKGPDTYREPLE